MDHRKVTEANTVGKVLKGTALEAMNGKSMRYSAAFIHDLRKAIDIGVETAINDKIDLKETLPQAERSVKSFIVTATQDAIVRHKTEVDTEAFLVAKEQMRAHDCSWPFC